MARDDATRCGPGFVSTPPRLDDCMNRLRRKPHEESSNTMNDDVFTVTHIEQAIDSLKFGKASGFDGFAKEHITFSHPAIVLDMKFLFTMIYKHGFVPDDFGRGSCVPLLEDRLVTTLHWTIIDPLHSVVESV